MVTARKLLYLPSREIVRNMENVCKVTGIVNGMLIQAQTVMIATDMEIKARSFVERRWDGFIKAPFGISFSWLL